MKPICYELLNGTLDWEGSSGDFSTKFTNNLPVPVTLDIVVPPGKPRPYSSGIPGVIPAGGSRYVGSDDQAPGYYKVTVTATGGLVNVYDCSADTGQQVVSLDQSALNVPNDIGPIPYPTSSVPSSPIEPQPNPPRVDSTLIVPPDSARVVVGCGVAPNGNLITREQFWDRQSDSICLAGNEKRTVSYTVTSGKQSTSSETETMSESLSSSISGGWGPVSASLSASLSHSSTSFQQVTVTEEMTSYVSNSITNPHEEPVAYFRWQLTDVITVFDATTGEPVASLVQAENPSIVMGPYWVTPRPAPPDSDTSETARGDGLFKYE